MTRLPSITICALSPAALACAVALALACSPARAGSPSTEIVPVQDMPAAAPLRRIVWTELKAKGVALPGVVIPAAPGWPTESLRVVNTTGKPRTFQLAVLDAPGIRDARWVVRGRIRHERVARQGYLEMWNVFPDGAQYFSRTLADAGPMARIQGTGDWRDVALPFNAAGTELRPSRLVVQLVLAGNGVVDVGPLSLFEGAGVSP